MLKTWLLKPYPFPTTTKSKIIISLVFGKFVFIFLILFKPFDFHIYKDKALYFAFIFGLITMSVMLINLLSFPLLLKKVFNPTKWNVYKMLLFVTNIIILIGFANWFFSNRLISAYISISSFLIYTVLVGLFPMLFYVYITEKIRDKKLKSVAESISEIKRTPKTSNIEICLKGENKKEFLKIELKNLLYISFEKNYSSVFYLEKGKIKENLIRTTLNSIEKQLVDFTTVIRCHKSYIVNTMQVIEMEGNARSYNLKITDVDLLIPVSRNFPKELLFTLVK